MPEQNLTMAEGRGRRFTKQKNIHFLQDFSFRCAFAAKLFASFLTACWRFFCPLSWRFNDPVLLFLANSGTPSWQLKGCISFFLLLPQDVQKEVKNLAVCGKGGAGEVCWLSTKIFLSVYMKGVSWCWTFINNSSVRIRETLFQLCS